MVATICFFFLTIYKWRIKTCDSIPLRMNYIFGNGRYAELVRTSIKFYGQQNIEAFIVDHEYILDDVLSRPQITLEKISKKNSSVFLGFTFENNKGPDFLERIAVRLLSLGLNLPGFDFSERPDHLKNGQGTQIFQNTYIDFSCSIGQFVQIRPGALIGHDTKIGDLTYIAPGAKLGSYVKIEEKCFLGFGCTVAPYTRIGNNCLIGAGAVVSGVIPDFSVVKADKPTMQKIKNPYKLL